MLAYQAPLQTGQECPHCTHVLRVDENPQEHMAAFHRDRLEAQVAYDATIARGDCVTAAQAAFNAVLASYAPPGPGKYDRLAWAAA